MQSIELKTGIEVERDWFNVWLCGQQVGQIIGRSRAIVHLWGVAAHKRIDWKAARAAYLEAVAAESAPEPPAAHETAAPVVVAVASESRPRCTFHKSIRRCFGIAKERGLNTRDDEAMRAAFGRYLCCDVPTRESLTASDWNILGDAIKACRLAW
jgi:hypothetical protein